jgi:thiamine-monophosphate kinase
VTLAVPVGWPAGRWSGEGALGAEFAFIDRIRARAGALGAVLGIGDDAALWRPGPDTDQVVTADLLLEGVHFDLAYTPLEGLGRKALSVNLSDIAAMGAVARWAVLSLGIAGDPDPYWPLVEAFLAQAEANAVTLIGGDTCASRAGLLIAVTLIGEVPAGRAVTRAGARPGDGVWVTGTPGESAAGLDLLKGRTAAIPPDARARLVGRHLDPTPRVAEGVRLRDAGVGAMIDVSDGLAGDLGHVLAASGVGAVLEADALPLSAALRAYCAAIGTDTAAQVLAGGEDYELVFAVPPEAEAKVRDLVASGAVAACRIGRFETEPGLRLRRGAQVRPITVRGYEHFA